MLAGQQAYVLFKTIDWCKSALGLDPRPQG